MGSVVKHTDKVMTGVWREVMVDANKLHFGIKTTQYFPYEDIRRVWLEADTIPAIEHAWLFDHPMPSCGPIQRPVVPMVGRCSRRWLLRRNGYASA